MLIINQGAKVSFRLWFFILACLHSPISTAQLLASFEIGEATIPAYTTTATEATPFTTITFDGEFASPPNVFALTPQFDADPCIIRIDNVTTTGFDVTCHEPLSEDRNSSGTVFEYLAIADGGLTIPLSGGGSIEFESECQTISTQQYAPVRCTNCAGPLSYTPITFNTAFSTAPAVIAQIQTVNNLNRDASAPTNEPEFLSTAIGDDPSSSITASGFNLSLERLEAGTGGVLASGETICYLAIETSASCQSLDFSSLGGPTTPVMFQALIGAQNVEGQNTAGVTTNFANGCFTSAPLTFASQITHNGPQGSFLRRISTTTSGITLIVDEDTVRDGERTHNADEQPAIMAFSQVFTTPVTLSGARVSVLNNLATFSWDTTAETFNLGFNLWGETEGGWVQINNRLITGNGVDTDEPRSYQRTFLLNEDNRDITQFGISSVDSTGYEEFYGPFSEGQEYGEQAINEAIDWTETRDQFEQSMRELGFVKENNRWLPISQTLTERHFGIDDSLVDVSVTKPGIHKIAVSELLQLIPSWRNLRLNLLALTLNGQAVPRHIISSNNRLSADDYIIFNASDVNPEDTPFLEHYTYRLSFNRTKALDANLYQSTNTDLTLTESALITETLTSKKLHSAGLTTGDPWYDARLLTTGTPTSVTYNADFPYAIDTTKSSELNLILFGSLDLPGDIDDHHIQVSVNGQLVHDVRFDGLIGYQQKITLPAGLVTTTNNTVTVTIVGDTGFFVDVVLVDEIRLSAYSSLSNQQRLRFDFADDEQALGYRISNSQDDLDVFAYSSTGLLTSIQAVESNGVTEFTRLPFEVSETNDTELRYAVSNTDNWPNALLNITQGQDLHSTEADYLIIAHPSFIGTELDEFVQFKTTLGHNVRVVDWLEVVNTYGYGNNTPSALNNFLLNASELYGIENVLIVGGHTFDYFGITDENIVNFIPSHYRPVSVFEYTATDNPYADLNGDNIPEIAIGRWPVRSVEELSLIIKKTKDWHQNRQDNATQDAYLVGQAIDSQNLSFEEQLNNRVKAPLLTLNEINQVNTLYLDNLPPEITDVVSHTRQQLENEINNGTDIISFSGHASPTAWGFQNIINTSFIQGLENQGEPILLMPLACYITHYESVSTNTLAHQWLFSGDRGAAAIHGASVLGDYRENGLFAERYLKQSPNHTTVGQAMTAAKQQLGSNNETLHNWILLGDPALPIR